MQIYTIPYTFLRIVIYLKPCTSQRFETSDFKVDKILPDLEPNVYWQKIQRDFGGKIGPNMPETDDLARVACHMGTKENHQIITPLYIQ